MSVRDIGKTLALGKSSVASLLLLQRLEASLLQLVWEHVLPSVVAYELAKMPPARQLKAWAAIKDKSNKLEALRAFLGETPAPARPAAPAPRRTTAEVRHALEALESDEARLLRDFFAALEGDEQAFDRLPPALAKVTLRVSEPPLTAEDRACGEQKGADATCGTCGATVGTRRWRDPDDDALVVRLDRHPNAAGVVCLGSGESPAQQDLEQYLRDEAAAADERTT
jgi:hypothetical protein